ncbi:MAG: hypothetical protein DMG06_24050 [Acidobacteria bacterium]|nr:MAG: hypothetical protein DMG06_24050 [Acidobacteriota bacterium]
MRDQLLHHYFFRIDPSQRFLKISERPELGTWSSIPLTAVARQDWDTFNRLKKAEMNFNEGTLAEAQSSGQTCPSSICLDRETIHSGEL